jgi:hypothetical protein
MNASTKEYLEKEYKQGKKKAGKVARKVINKGKRLEKKFSSITTKTVPVSDLKLAELAAQEGGNDASGKAISLAVTVYDKNYNLLRDVSEPSLGATSYNYTVNNEKFQGLVVDDSNTIGASLGSGRKGHYLKVESKLEIVTFNFSHTTLNAQDAYMGTRGDTLFVVYVSPTNKFERLLMIPKSSRFARTLRVK